MSQIRHALSASFKDVNDQYLLCSDGDTIIVPGGGPIAHWTDELVVDKAIKIQGATTISGAGTSGCTANDQTIIVCDATTKGSLFRFQTSPAQDFNNPELSGITFQAGLAAIPKVIAASSGSGPVRSLRIHDCHNDGGNFVLVGGWNYGVVDHCLIEGHGQAVLARETTYGDKTFGNGSWADYPWFGTYRFFFVEDNTFISDGATATVNNIDAEHGARFVARYNYWHNCRPGWHGTEAGDRGTRAVEVYNNHFHWTFAPSSSNRSGTSLYHDNIYDGTASGNDTVAGLHIFRAEGAEGATYLFGFADGTSPWDSNDPHGLYYTGTATSGAQGGTTATVTVSGTPWTVNQWAGYSIHQTAGQAAGKGSYIISNTSNTITYAYYSTTDRGPTLKFVANDTFTINRCFLALDQPGRGKGDLLTGTPSTGYTNVALGGEAWPRNALEPCYSWNNHYTPTDRYYGFSAGAPMIQLNREYYNLGHVSEIDGAQAAVIAKYVAALNGENYNGIYTYPHPLQGNVTAVISSTDHTTFVELAVSSFPMATTGFSGSVTFSKTGTLPSGVTLSSSGVLSGTPAAATAGTYGIVVTATDGTSTDTQNFTLTVAAATTKIISLSGSMAFGFVTIGTTASKNLTITNNGNSVLTVSGITYPTGFSGNWAGGTIAAGASHTVAVTFSPASGISYSGTITVASDKTSGTNTTSASGTGATRVIAISGSLAFGNITTGQTATRSVTVSNSGTAPMTVSSVTYPEGFSGNYSGGSIAAGGSTVVDVTFSPLLAQAYSGDVTFSTDKTSGTDNVAATGTGTASATKIIQLTGSLAYGNLETGTTLSKALTITNSGTATLTVTAVTVPTGYTPDWTAGTIAAGASQVVNITFAPVAVTSYNGTVTVSSDATGGTNTHAISGSGVSAATKIIALSGNMVFGNVLIGSTNGRTLTITNSGSAVMTVTGITLPTGFSGSFSGTIAAGASQDVTITFSPLAAQLYSGTISVASDKTSGTATMAISGTGVVPTTRIIGLTGNLAFGNVVKNHNTQKTLTITNSGTAPLNITSITYPTGFTGDFASGSIAAGASQNVIVTFRPTAAQSYGGVVTVASNKTSGLNTINCSGTGVNKKQVPFVLIVG